VKRRRLASNQNEPYRTAQAAPGHQMYFGTQIAARAANGVI
jgi:hypothetical protein